jgi:hypothetical protein
LVAVTVFGRLLDGGVVLVVVVVDRSVVDRIWKSVLLRRRRRNSVRVLILVESVVDAVRRLRVDLVMLSRTQLAVVIGGMRMLAGTSEMRLAAEVV